MGVGDRLPDVLDPLFGFFRVVSHGESLLSHQGLGQPENGPPNIAAGISPKEDHSTVTDLARFLGLSMSHPLARAT